MFTFIYEYGEAKEYPKNSGIRYRLRLDTNNYEVSAGVRITGRRYRYSTGLDTLEKAKAHCLEVSKMSRNTDEDFRAHDKARKVAFNKIGLTATKRGLSTRQTEKSFKETMSDLDEAIRLNQRVDWIFLTANGTGNHIRLPYNTHEDYINIYDSKELIEIYESIGYEYDGGTQAMMSKMIV